MDHFALMESGEHRTQLPHNAHSTLTKVGLYSGPSSTSWQISKDWIIQNILPSHNAIKLEIGNKKDHSKCVWKLGDMVICGWNNRMSEIFFKNILVARQRVGRGYRWNKSGPELINVEIGERYMGVRYTTLSYISLTSYFFQREILLGYPWIKEEIIVETAKYFTWTMMTHDRIYEVQLKPHLQSSL